MTSQSRRRPHNRASCDQYCTGWPPGAATHNHTSWYIGTRTVTMYQGRVCKNRRVYTHTQTTTEGAAHTSMLAHTVAHPTCSATAHDAHTNLIKKYNYNTRIYWSTLVCSRRYFLYAQILTFSCLPCSGIRPGASPPSPLRSTAAFNKNFRAPPPPLGAVSHAFRPIRQTFHPCPTDPWRFCRVCARLQPLQNLPRFCIPIH